MKYSSSFTYDLELGENAEDWVFKLFHGKEKIEVKTDFIAHKTGNIFIEYESRGKPSGIATTTARYWVYRVESADSAIIVSVERLKEVCRDFYKKGEHKTLGGDNNTSKGVLLPIAELFKITNFKIN